MAIEELKQDYPDSPAKQAFCDMLASVIETYFMNVVGKLANRDSVNIGVELIHANAKIPTYAHEGDQGADIYAVEEIVVEPHTYGNVIPTGLKVIIPHDWCLSIRPRSGLSKNSTLRISNSPATIDQQYRGEIKVLIDNIGDAPVTIKAGERIAQMILERNYQAKYHKVDSVEPDTERGEGGFGSSGN
jgi:dUTP pyrophosphatase